MDESPFDFFYEDVISYSLSFDFSKPLGNDLYRIACDDALNCISICDNFHKISHWIVNGWLQVALKFVDNLVFHYMQVRSSKFPKYNSKLGVEKWRYEQISKLDGEISIAGYNLIELYNLRNRLEHRTKEHPNGRQELIQPDRKKMRHIVVNLYPDVLKIFLNEYIKLNMEPDS